MSIEDNPNFSFLKEFHDDGNRPDIAVALPQAQTDQVMAGMSSWQRQADVALDVHARLENVRQAANPLLEAARPLLRVLADMPAQLPQDMSVEQLRNMLVREVMVFQRLCDQAQLPWKHMAVLRYCLCTAVDEAINRTTWGGGGIWARKSLLISFEGEADGGEKFFLLIGRMAVHPHMYADVIEVLLRILGLGFEGRYSVIEDGGRHLEKIRKRLMHLLAGCRETVPAALSPHAQGKVMRAGFVLSDTPLWSGMALCLLVFALCFGWYKWQLEARWQEIAVRIAAMSGLPVQKPLRLSVLLQHEIAQGLVTVEEDAYRSHVVFRGDDMFLSGKTRVRQEVRPILARVAHEIARVGGKVSVIGHTDNQRVRDAALGNNQILSEERAADVATQIQQHGVALSDMTITGMGETQPVADNQSREGMARNRRVEIIVEHREA